MKNLVMALALLSSQYVKAANYYFSSSGNDAHSSAQAQNPLTPWRSLNGLNSFMNSLQPGDSVLFRRGDTFYGQMIITRSGNASQKIHFGAYGSGAQPIISGFYLATTWNNTGNGIWESDCTSCGQFTNAVNINGHNIAMGRFPNSDASNKGYLKFESHSGNTQITDNELSGTPNWTGAELVIRKNYWTLDRNLVTQHNNGTLQFISPTGHPLLDNYGYFFQNHLQTLDKSGEWYYDPAQKKLKIFFGAAGPGSNVVKIGTVDTLVSIQSRNYISFNDLRFEGADTSAFAINNATDIRIQNCHILYSGIDGVNARNSEQIVLESCRFDETNNNAIRITDCNRSEVRNCQVLNTGLMAGMGLSNNQMYEAIYTRGSGNTVEYNEVINTGYSAITFSGEQAVVRNNFIENYTMVLDDGGGIYGWGDFDKYGRVISHNIILNGIGAPEGTDVSVAGNSSGIYLDDRSANVEISHNTVAGANRAGVYLHNSHEIVLQSNTLFNNNAQVAMVHDDLEPADPIRNVTMQQNIFFSRTDRQSAANFASRQNDISSFGTYSSNYYARPIDPQGIIQTDYRNSSGEYINQRHNLPAWKALYNNDAGSLPSPLDILPFLVNNTVGANRCSNGSFNADINGVFCMSSPVSCATSWNSGGRLDGGALEIRSTGAATNISTHVSVGSVQAGKNYRIRFSLLGSTANQTVGAYILKNGAPYNALSEKKYFALGTNRTENEFLFSATSTEADVYLIFTISQGQQPFWVDNIDVREVDVTISNPDDFIRFEYNRSSSSKTVVLDAAYIDVKNQAFVNTLTLAPFTSAVLLRTGVVLPVKFLNAWAERVADQVEIKWSVAQQQDIARYEVEKSADGVTFTAMNKTITANQNANASYSITDDNAGRESNCYRIKAVSKTGLFFYSQVVCVRPEASGEISLYPNPAVNELMVRLPSNSNISKAELSVLDWGGRLVQASIVPVVNNKLLINISMLSAGIYLLRIKAGTENYSRKFIRQSAQ